ncbi:MAG: coagulation factor 5/8 type domain-containing protein, partial [Acidobacteriota bacterium]
MRFSERRHPCRPDRRLPAGPCLMLAVIAFAFAPAASALDWTPHPSDGVTVQLTREGDANRLDFDFHGHAGYAIARSPFARDLPANYQLTFRVRGDAPAENLELKLLRGDDVWWLNRRDFHFPGQYETVKTKKRQIAFAWGPSGGGELTHIDALEVVVTAGSGGKGTVWFTDPEIDPLPPTPAKPVLFRKSSIDFGSRRELGGLVVDWKGPPPESFQVTLDGVGHAYGATRFVWLPDAEARTISVSGPVKTITVQPPTWAPTGNDFVSIVARASRRGDYPRYFLGEQAYWTVIGADGGDSEALVGEDGSVEPFKGGFSIEPSLVFGGKRLTWADVVETQTLAEGDLPIPSVTWKHGGVKLTMTAAVSSSSMLQLRYVIQGRATLRLEARPYQVNPSTQWLNTTGGVSRIDEALFQRIQPLTKPFRVEGYALVYRDVQEVELDVPLEPNAQREPFARIAGQWREKLHRVAIDIPAAPEIGNTVRTNIAYMLIQRDGPALKPGSRSYDRAWIRDGALMAATLLHLGHKDVAKSFTSWFARFQYENGKVPCCVDSRGADPVPENDSHGELIYIVAEIYRVTHDVEFVRRLWPNVRRASQYIDELRAQNHGQFEGLLTESISHEGYSAKAMHSYWDDLFGLRGLQDAAMLAGVLGLETDRVALQPSADSFRRDLAASIGRTIDEHHIAFVPGSAELGDFDATSTSIGISPLNLAAVFPQRELGLTYDRYLAELQKPRDDYTPYEMRTIGALIRLGRRSDAVPLIERFLRDRRPLAWNGWAEVVRTDSRKGGFIGDMPHSWVASDFIRSILDAFAYDDGAGVLVVGAGVPRSWLAGPMHVGPFATESGTIDVHMRAGFVHRMRATLWPK